MRQRLPPRTPPRCCSPASVATQPRPGRPRWCAGAIIFGLIALFSRSPPHSALAIVIGAYAIVNGVFDIIEAIRHRGSSSMVLRIVLGVVSILFGILVLVWPGISLAILVIMVAIWAIMIGILQIVSSVGHRAVPNSGWVWGIIGGALSILFGILAA